MSATVSAILLAATLIGPAVVHDGDTLRIGHQSVRLYGVDAEELSEPEGFAARDKLREIIGGSTVYCVPTGRRSYNRLVAICYRQDGLELNAAIIQSGEALDCPHYSHGRYAAYEAAGIRAKLIQKPYCTRRW